MVYIDLFLQIAAVVLYLLLLWFGLKRVDLSKYTQISLALLDIILLIISTIKLGWIGYGAVAIANIIGIFIWSFSLFMRKDTLLTNAAAQSTNKKKDLELLYNQLPSNHKVFKTIGPIDRARLIYLLSRRGRSIDEILKMALPIALLWYVHKPELEQFVDKFDRLIRLWNKSADEAMGVADIMTATSRQSAATFEEIIDGLIAFRE